MKGVVGRGNGRVVGGIEGSLKKGGGCDCGIEAEGRGGAGLKVFHLSYLISLAEFKRF